MPKLDLHGFRNPRFTAHGRIAFEATDDVRGECELTLSDPEDVYALADFLATVLTVWESGENPHARFRLIPGDAA